MSVPHRTALAAAVASPARKPDNVARDRYRNPAATLAFFDVRPDSNVVEIFPGGGWYSEIIAPYVIKGGGTYNAAAPDRLNGFRKLAATNPALYGNARTAAFPGSASGDVGVPAGIADVVVTFRNVHNWMMGDKPYAEVAFRQMYAMLKPGGVLGVEDIGLPNRPTSRSNRRAAMSRSRRSAVWPRPRASALSARARSTPTRTTPRTIPKACGRCRRPPLKDKDRASYAAIGESDRMTLKFVKPR